MTKPGFETFEGSGQAQNVMGDVRFTLAPHGNHARRHGAGARRRRRRHRPVAGFLHRQVRGHQQGLQALRRCRRLSYRAVLAAIDDADGRTVSWEEAVAEFRDTTGRPGPATWELGTYPEGQDDWPVRGVSWYEAAAYARFAGKSLPTVHHWRLAAGLGIHSAILEWSNFSGKGPARAGEYLGIGPYGTFDMAGNVKEWCANRRAATARYIMGGAWNEPNYQYQQADARLAEDRSDNNGLRLVDAARPGRYSSRGLWTRRAARPVTTASKNRSATTCSARSPGCTRTMPAT